MNQERIGKFIQEKRKKEKLTKKQLSEKLNVSEKTISKWECGKGLPEVSLMQPLCKELKISVNELLNGHDNQKENNNQGYIDYIKYNNKKNKNKIIVYISIITILIIIFMLGIYFINNYGKITVYKLYGESENFTYLDGLLIKSNDKNILVQGKIISNDENKIKTENIIHTSFKSLNEIIVSESINGINIEKNGYSEIFTNEKLNNLNNWHLEITYLINNKEQTEIIEIKNDLIINSNKFLTEITSPIGITSKIPSTNTKKNNCEEKKILEQKLIKNSFNLIKNNLYAKETKDYVIRVNSESNYIRAYKNNVSYGEDSIDIKYNSEKYDGNIIELELSEEKKSYYVLYDINTETLSCANNECPSSAWQVCYDFYNYIKELLDIK